MNYIDYRKELGIGFNDKAKFKYFQKRILNHMSELDKNTPFFSAQEFFYFCIETGMDFRKKMFDDYFDDIVYILNNSESLEEFLSKYIFCLICYKDTYNGIRKIWTKDDLRSLLKDTLTESRIPFEIIEDNGEMFIFPQGAKELDANLISAPLEWLKDYPKTRDTFVRALKQYANKEHTRDVADNFRKTLEEFFREYLGNNKDFDKNKSEICIFLKEKGADKNITNMLEPLLDRYKKLNDDQVKHNDKLDSKFLEFIMYQTGLFIRMIIVAGKEDV